MSRPASMEVQSGSDLALVSIPRQKCLYVAKENFFYQSRKIHSLITSFQKHLNISNNYNYFKLIR